MGQGAWQFVTTDVVTKSFLVCGISPSINGLQDSEINDGGIAAEAAVTIAAWTQDLALANQEE